MKSKNAPQTTRSKVTHWVILLTLVLSLKIMSYGLFSYANLLPLSGDTTILYLPAFFNSVLFLIIFLASLIMLGLYIYSLQKLPAKALMVRAVIGSLFFVVLTMLEPVSSIPLNGYLFPPVDVDSLSLPDHTYQLIQQYQRYHPHQGGGKYTYTILECDPSGLICHAYRPALQTAYTLKPFTCFEDIEAKKGQLEQDPITQRLVIHVGTDAHQIEPTEDMFVYEACSEGGFPR